MNPLQPLTAALQAFNNLIGQMIPNLRGVTAQFTSLGQAMVNVGAAITNALSSIANIGGAVVTSIAGIGSALVNLLPFSSRIGGWFSQLGTVLSQFGSSVLSAGGSAISSLPGFQTISGLIGTISGKISGVVGAVGSALGGVGSAFVSLLSAIPEVGTAIGGMIGSVLGLGQQMAQFVQLANPAAFQLFTNAVDDLMAVIGQALTPVFLVITQVVRMAADSIASWAPTLGAIIGQLASGLLPLFQIFLNVFSYIGQALVYVVKAAAPAIAILEQMWVEIYGALEPVIKTLVELVAGVLGEAMKWLADAIQYVAPYVIAFALALRDAFMWMLSGIKELLGLAGIETPDFGKPKAGESVGAAAKGANIGSVESVIQAAQKSAYSLGTAAKATDSAIIRTADTAAAIKAKADEIHQYLMNLPDEISEAVQDWAENSINQTINQVGKWVVGAIDALNPFSDSEASGGTVVTDAINSVMPTRAELEALKPPGAV